MFNSQRGSRTCQIFLNVKKVRLRNGSRKLVHCAISHFGPRSYAWLSTCFLLWFGVKVQTTFVNSCQIQILQRHRDQFTEVRLPITSVKWLRCLCNIWIWQRLITKGRLNFNSKVASICLEAEFGAYFQVQTSFSGGKSSAISMIFGRFLAKSPPSTCRRLAGERTLDVAEIWRSLEALCVGCHPKLHQ